MILKVIFLFNFSCVLRDIGNFVFGKFLTTETAVNLMFT